MKLQKQISRKVKGKEYVKFVVVIPNKIIKELGWENVKELDGYVNKLTLTFVERLIVLEEKK